MRKAFKLDGDICANCAARIQDKVAKLDGVNSASVNVMTLKFTLDADDARFDDFRLFVPYKDIAGSIGLRKLEVSVTLWSGPPGDERHPLSIIRRVVFRPQKSRHAGQAAAEQAARR